MSNANVRKKRWSIIGRSAAKIDFGGLLRAGGRRFERRHRLRAMNQLCTNHFRKGTDTGVIIAYCLIIVAPSDRYAIFCSFKLALHRQELLVGFALRSEEHTSELQS